MSAQKSKKADRGGGGTRAKKAPKAGAETKGEAVLQAVVLADSYQDRYRPLTMEKPRCLLPLANVPLIEYTLEFLAANGVQEVYIYCGSHADQVEDYISTSRWAQDSFTCPFSVIQLVRLSQSGSIGDVMRDLDRKSVLDGDFILVHGDLVSNISLEGVLAAHRARREADPANIMTMVLRDGGIKEHRTKTKGITPVFAIDYETKRCLHYDEMHPFQTDRSFLLDPIIVKELSTDFELRADLIDPGIDICTPEVLLLWSESYDYQLPRKDFLRGVLNDWELNGKSIYAEVLETGYAARASNLMMYESVTKDVLGRWTLPLVPDHNLLPDTTYRNLKGSAIEEDTTLCEEVSITSSVIGGGTYVSSGAVISRSIIGRGCTIGKNARIKDAFIWDGVTIGDEATVERSLLADGVSVGDGCSIPSGCVVSFGAKIAKNTTLQQNMMISKVSSTGAPVATDSKIVGQGGEGAEWIDDEDLDEDDPSSLQRNLIYSIDHLTIAAPSISSFGSDDEDSDDEYRRDDLLTPASSVTRNRLSSFASDDSAMASAARSGFHTDAVNGLLEALRADSGDFDGAKLEFMGLRLANDASDVAMRRAVATAFARYASELVASGLEPVKAADKALKGCDGVAKFISEVGVGGGETEQVEFALALQKALVSDKTLEAAKAGVLLAALFQHMYDMDILEEDAILRWWGDQRAEEGESMKALKQRCKVLVEWLENADEDDDDDDEDEEDEDED